MNDQTVIAASGAVSNVPMRRMPGWHGPDETPDVPRGGDQFFQIAVRRKHSDKVFSFPAVYCNSYAVTVECDPHESHGNGWSMHFLAEDLADEGELGCSGWWDIKSDNEYEFHFTPALNEGDELVGWCELPQWADSADLTSREAKRDAPVATIIFPDRIGIQLCAPISLEWMAEKRGYREGWNNALAKVEELNNASHEAVKPVAHFIETSPGNWEQAALVYAGQPGVTPLYRRSAAQEAYCNRRDCPCGMEVADCRHKEFRDVAQDAA